MRSVSLNLCYSVINSFFAPLLHCVLALKIVQRRHTLYGRQLHPLDLRAGQRFPAFLPFVLRRLAALPGLPAVHFGCNLGHYANL